MRKKLLLLAIGIPILVYILWLGHLLLSFKPYTVPSASASLEIEGAYHIHTTCSDGKKSPESIAKIASRLGLNFIILIDHGNPNYEILASEGWQDKVLVLSGSELNVDRGHLVALDFLPPDSTFSPKADEACQQVASLGGFSIIAHPYLRKKPWLWGGYSGYRGIEVMNGDSLLRKDFLSSLPYLPLFFINPEFVLLKMVDDPKESLQKWDEMNENHLVFSYFGSDAHFFYRPLLSFLRLHIQLEHPLPSDFEKAKHQVLEMLRSGRFYNAVDGAGRARGFNFWAHKGERMSLMGESLTLDSPVTLEAEAPFPFAVELSFVHNGERVLRAGKKRVSYEVKKPGAYRVEVYIREKTPLKRAVPWIVSNPIFIKGKGE